jgi:tetratricopeptide (TPR) repeat protein
MLALVNLLSERWQDAVDAAEQARAVQTTTRTAVPFEPYVLAYLAEGHAALGNLQEAREHAERAVELAIRFGKRFELHCRIARASIALKLSDAGARAVAIADLEAAEALRNELGANAFEPIIDVQRAELARLDGDEVAWRAGLRKAHRLFSEMGMTGRAERVARELGLVTTGR